jgi:hypothetical protein
LTLFVLSQFDFNFLKIRQQIFRQQKLAKTQKPNPENLREQPLQTRAGQGHP